MIRSTGQFQMADQLLCLQMKKLLEETSELCWEEPRFDGNSGCDCRFRTKVRYGGERGIRSRPMGKETTGLWGDV